MANILKDHHGCQGNGCTSTTDVTLRVAKSQQLSPECVGNNRHSIGERKSERRIWTCPEHDHEITFVCKTHSAMACQLCVASSHQPPCLLADVQSHVWGEQVRFGMLLSKLETMEGDLEKYVQTITSHSAYAAHLLRGIETYILDAYSEETESVKKDLARKDDLAKREAEVEINRIREKLNVRMRRNQLEADGKLRSVKIETDLLLSKLKQSIREVAVIPNRMRMISLQKSGIVCGMRKKIKGLIGNEEQLLTGGYIEAAVQKTLQTDLNTSILETLDKIVERISFSRKGGNAVGALTDMEGVWELAGKVDLSTIRVPLLAGHVGTKSMFVTDIMKKILHVVNLKDKGIEPLMQSGNLGCVSDCSSLNKDKFVCGNYANGSVCFFSRSWTHLREIRLQDHPTASGDPVYLDIDRKGRVVAILYGQPDIFIIDPILGVLNTVTPAHCRSILDIHALPSGDLLVQTGLNRFRVFNANLEEKKVIHRAHWETATCAVDKAANLVYVTFKEVGKTSYAIDVVCPEGEIFSERCVVFPAPARADSTPRCQSVGHGKLVVCSGDQLLMYKKAFGIDDIRILNRLFANQSDDEALSVHLEDTDSIASEVFV